MNKIISIKLTQRQPTTVTKNRLVVATIPVLLKQPSPVLDKLMSFRCGKYMMLQAGYACYKLSKKLFGFWWNTLVRHKRMCGVDSDFLENVPCPPTGETEGRLK
jgi:hypothetical protein